MPDRFAEVAVPLRALKSAAPLKRAATLQALRKDRLSPRPQKRGPVEAVLCRLRSLAASDSPRPQKRGPVEARPGCVGLSRRHLPLRALKSAAPLKPLVPPGVSGSRLSLRALKSAAPLKQRYPTVPAHDRAALRALKSAAPLKLRLTHRRSLGNFTSPRPQKRGPVEAGSCGRMGRSLGRRSPRPQKRGPVEAFGTC